MNMSVSLPDPGEFHRGRHNGHATGVLIDELPPYGPAYDDAGGVSDDPDLLRTPGVLPLDVAEVGELLAAPGLELGPGLVEEQTRILEQELRAELEHLDLEELLDTHQATGPAIDSAIDSGTNSSSAHDNGSEPLPGFEALTWADLDRARLGRGNLAPDHETQCPVWCADADLPHGDGFDTAPEAEIPHRGVPHDIPTKHGGKSIDHTGPAEVSLQLEQDRDPDARPVITLSVVVRGIEQYAWLTAAEATALHRILGQMVDDTTDTN